MNPESQILNFINRFSDKKVVRTILKDNFISIKQYEKKMDRLYKFELEYPKLLKENQKLKKELKLNEDIMELNEKSRKDMEHHIEILQEQSQERLKEINQLKKEFEELKRLNKKYKPYFDRLRKGA